MNKLKAAVRKKLIRIIREPVFLFFTLGFLLFFVYTQTSNYYRNKNKTILINPEQIGLLQETFKKTWNRDPSDEEMEALIDNYIMDEIFFKEARAMGLDKSDPAIKRRLRQLIEMMVDEMTVVYPSEDQLNRYLQENQDKFRLDPTISLRQVYFQYDNKNDAIDIMQKLNNGVKVNENKMGTVSMLQEVFKDETYRNIERVFGREFADAVFKLETKSWQGPVESAYGWHIVYISKITQGYVPELKEIWDQVEREWTLERKNELKEIQYSNLKEKYNIRFENIE